MSIVNKKAYFDYHIKDTLEVGIVLVGNEVKSIREGRCNIKDAWVTVQNDELVIRGMHVTNWGTSNVFDLKDEKRERKLLAHKSQISSLKQIIQTKGYTLVPLELYSSKQNKFKIKLGIAQGKHNYDKRQAIKERDLKREAEKALKN